MSRLTGRASALLFLMLSILLVGWIIPSNAGPGYTGSLQPATLPTLAAALMGIGALVSLLEPGGRERLYGARLRRTAVYLGLLALPAGMMSLIGLIWTAPALILATMLTAGERRPAWLALGTILVPLAIWAIFEIGLGRPLP